MGQLGLAQHSLIVPKSEVMRFSIASTQCRQGIRCQHKRTILSGPAGTIVPGGLFRHLTNPKIPATTAPSKHIQMQ